MPLIVWLSPHHNGKLQHFQGAVCRIIWRYDAAAVAAAAVKVPSIGRKCSSLNVCWSKHEPVSVCHTQIISCNLTYFYEPNLIEATLMRQSTMRPKGSSRLLNPIWRIWCNTVGIHSDIVVGNFSVVGTFSSDRRSDDNNELVCELPFAIERSQLELSSYETLHHISIFISLLPFRSLFNLVETLLPLQWNELNSKFNT